MKIFYRQGNLFKIDETLLNKQAKKTENKNALYAAVYSEFIGASENPIYKNLNPSEKMNELNVFAEKWLKDRGLL